MKNQPINLVVNLPLLLMRARGGHEDKSRGARAAGRTPASATPLPRRTSAGSLKRDRKLTTKSCTVFLRYSVTPAANWQHLLATNLHEEE